MREEPDMPFDELVYGLAEGIANAQTKLDYQTAEMLQVLAETEVDVVPQITRNIDEEGDVTTEVAPVESRSLLALGFEPTRYQFSEATVEVNFDVSIMEEQTTEEESENEYGLFVGTRNVQEERRYRREVESTATMNATLAPVPLPARLSPAESFEEEPEP